MCHSQLPFSRMQLTTMLTRSVGVAGSTLWCSLGAHCFLQCKRHTASRQVRKAQNNSLYFSLELQYSILQKETGFLSEQVWAERKRYFPKSKYPLNTILLYTIPIQPMV